MCEEGEKIMKLYLLILGLPKRTLVFLGNCQNRYLLYYPFISKEFQPDSFASEVVYQSRLYAVQKDKKLSLETMTLDTCR
jgi:hypothetical protein